MIQIQKIDLLISSNSELISPIEANQGLYVCAKNGDILKFENQQTKLQCKIIGQPSSFAINKQNMDFYIADLAHQAIVVRKYQVQQQNIQVKQHNKYPFNGPHSIIYVENMNALFFTDSGPFGQTSIENCVGSLFAYGLQQNQIKALAYRKLAYPTGLQVGNQQKVLQYIFISYVCQMCKNRIIKFNIESNNQCYSTFYQFNGLFGPSCIAIKGQLLYVGLFQFKQLSKQGSIAILNDKGEYLDSIKIEGSQIVGITFSLFDNNIIYLTESSKGGRCYKITLKNQQNQQSFTLQIP